MTRKRGEMNPIDARKGLHCLKNDFQKEYMAQQCDDLLYLLDAAIASTMNAAPIRMQGYFNRVRVKRMPRRPEARWEQSMWEQWSVLRCNSVPGAWYRIAYYQLNLPDSRKTESWGEIDLVGVSHHGLPVVVELKAPHADDPPATLLVQAAAYALVLKKAWPVIAPEWTALVRKYGFDLSFSSSLSMCPLVCAAPGNYWNEWIGETPRARTVSKTAWTSFMRLVLAFAERGLPTTFVQLDESYTDADGLPREISARVIDPFL
jgi:hypothetical protein